MSRLKEKCWYYFKYYFKWILISAVIGVGAGFASGIFLYLLEKATLFREGHLWLLSLLPFGGLLIGLGYHQWGRRVAAGNDLIIEEFHNPKSIVPFRMAPLVLIGTIFTHFFGGSAGREGTAVQMGGAIADQLTRILKLNESDRRTVLMAGMAGGFGSVFGVPFAGAVFGMEVLAMGKIQLKAVVECLIASFVAHNVTLAIGIHHTDYLHPDTSGVSLSVGVIFYSVIAGIVFGLTAKLFSRLTHGIGRISKMVIPALPIRTLVGGIVLSLLFFIFPLLIRYSGLGVPVIVASLKTELPLHDWFGKLVLTSLTLGFGFKGGEVTPLLFIGATLGNALSTVLPIQLPILAAMGFVGVFAGAANTPLACTIMAMEIFGPGIGIFAAIASFTSFAVSGHPGIYHAQRSRSAPSYRAF